uniref:Uncharacterized protein n=1 Tax=Triticum urartu TaxID=4572 RepID=A0A8R7UMM3_TRIUA
PNRNIKPTNRLNELKISLTRNIGSRHRLVGPPQAPSPPVEHAGDRAPHPPPALLRNVVAGAGRGGFFLLLHRLLHYLLPAFNHLRQHRSRGGRGLPLLRQLRVNGGRRLGLALGGGCSLLAAAATLALLLPGQVLVEGLDGPVNRLAVALRGPVPARPVGRVAPEAPAPELRAVGLPPAPLPGRGGLLPRRRGRRRGAQRGEDEVREHLLPLGPQRRRHGEHDRGEQPEEHPLRRLAAGRRRRRRRVDLALAHFLEIVSRKPLDVFFP